ncbi:MAG: DUF1294 domain-containing protein [Clostridium sp.]
MNYFLVYLIIINVCGFLIMYIDKSRARSNSWRIKESTLFFIALIGGSLGSILGMNFFRHKTKHLSFKLGLPAILVIQVFLYLSKEYFL